MLVYLSTLAAALFYAAQVPIRFAFTLKLGPVNQLSVGVGLFWARLIYKKEVPITGSLLKSGYEKYGGHEETEILKASLHAAHRFLQRSRVEDGRLSIAIGTGDAARTALLCGAIEGAASALNGWSGVRLPVRVAPDFSGQQLMVSAGGMAHVRVGHIIDAALAFARHLMTGRIQRWTSTQLRTS